MNFERLRFSDVPWEELDSFADRTIFQTREWITFLVNTQCAEPVVARLTSHRRTAGYFTGLIFQRFGVRILGSPFPGWTTSFMGFNLRPGTNRSDALRALKAFAFRDLKCWHVEVCDPHFSCDDGRGAGYKCTSTFTYQSDLTLSEDELFRRIEPTCRNKVRQAERKGVIIEDAHDFGFAAEYYAQLIQVFAKQNLYPTYTQERVEQLIDSLLPSGHLLLLRARDPAGACIATGIYAGVNKLAEFWGNASSQSSLHLRPNEAMHWYAMRYWKKIGLETLNWGRGAYKEKYGVVRAPIARLSQSRLPMIGVLRDNAERAFYWKRQLSATFKNKGDARSSPSAGKGGRH